MHRQMLSVKVNTAAMAAVALVAIRSHGPLLRAASFLTATPRIAPCR